MNKVLQGFLSSDFVYSYEMGPEQVPDTDTAFRTGINCVSLAHLVLNELFGQVLPRELDCFEMFTDKDRFEKVRSVMDAQLGDLVWFGRKPLTPAIDFVPDYDDRGHLVNWPEHPLEHVAIATGELGEDRDPLLLHATHIEGTTAVWPLSRFLEQPRYAEVHGVSRLRISNQVPV